MRKIVSLLLGVLGLIWTSLQFGCQERPLVATRAPSSPRMVEEMLYFLPMGKMTTHVEYTIRNNFPETLGKPPNR